MFNTVSKAIYYFAGTSYEDAVRQTRGYRDQVQLGSVPGESCDPYNERFVGSDNFKACNLEFPRGGGGVKVSLVWGRVIQISRIAQTGFFFTGLGLCAVAWKAYQKWMPVALSAIVLAGVSFLAIYAARGVRKEAQEGKESLHPEMIAMEVRCLRLDVAGNGLEEISNPSDARFFFPLEINGILHKWIMEHAPTESSSSSSSNCSSLIRGRRGWSLDELINPNNKVMQALIQRLEVNNPIKSALNFCNQQGFLSGTKPFSERFLEAYTHFHAKYKP